MDNTDARRLYERCGFQVEQHTADAPLQFLRRPVLRAFLGFPAWLRMCKLLGVAKPGSSEGFHGVSSAAHSTPTLSICTTASAVGGDPVSNPGSSHEGASLATVVKPGRLTGSDGALRVINITAHQPEHGSWAAQPATRDMHPAAQTGTLPVVNPCGTAEAQEAECASAAGAVEGLDKKAAGASIAASCAAQHPITSYSRALWQPALAWGRPAAALSDARSWLCHAAHVFLLLLFAENSAIRHGSAAQTSPTAM